MFGFGKRPLARERRADITDPQSDQYPQYNELMAVNAPQMLMPAHVWYAPKYFSVAFPYGYAALQGVYQAYLWPKMAAPPAPHVAPGMSNQDKKGSAAPAPGNADDEYIGYRAPRLNEIVRSSAA